MAGICGERLRGTNGGYKVTRLAPREGGERAEDPDGATRLRLLTEFLMEALPHRRKLAEGLPMVESVMRVPKLPGFERFLVEIHGWGEFEVTVDAVGGPSQVLPEIDPPAPEN